MIKILSWNIRQGGGTRLPEIFKALRLVNAHVVVLSEFRNNDAGMKIRQTALQLGYRYQLVSAAKKDVNSVITLSKFPGNSELISPEVDREYCHNLIKLEMDAFSVYGMYLPHKKKHTLFDLILKRAQQDKKPMVFCGDMNTGINYVDQKGNSFWYEDELIELGSHCRDAFRHINKDVKEYSWYSHQGNGYRYDHMYVHENLSAVVSNCYYLHEYRERGLSDHSPMILEIGGDQPAPT